PPSPRISTAPTASISAKSRCRPSMTWARPWGGRARRGSSPHPRIRLSPCCVSVFFLSPPFPLDGGRDGDGGESATWQQKTQEARRLASAHGAGPLSPPPNPPPSRGRALFRFRQCPAEI